MVSLLIKCSLVPDYARKISRVPTFCTDGGTAAVSILIRHMHDCLETILLSGGRCSTLGTESSTAVLDFIHQKRVIVSPNPDDRAYAPLFGRSGQLSNL